MGNKVKTWIFDDGLKLKIRVLKEAGLWADCVQELKAFSGTLELTETSLTVDKADLVDEAEFFDLTAIALRIVDNKYKELLFKL